MQYLLEMYWDKLDEWVTVDEDCTMDRAFRSYESYQRSHPDIPKRIHDTDNRIYHDYDRGTADYDVLHKNPMWPLK